jgi:flagellar hook-length control protein FliK
MATSLSLLQPISALGNQSAAMRSTVRSASDVQGNNPVTAGLLNDETLNAEHSFSQLLNDSAEPKPIEILKQKMTLMDEVGSDSIPIMDLSASEIAAQRGNKLPFEGQTLPLSTVLVTEKLAEGFHQISADQLNLADLAFAQDTGVLSASLIDNSELALNNETLLNVQTDNASLVSLNLENSELTTDTLPTQTRETFSNFNGQFVSDSNLTSSHMSTLAVDQAIAGPSNPDDIKQGRTKGVEFLNNMDGLGADQDAESEFTKFEGITSTQGAKVSDKVLQVVPGNFLTATAGDAGVVQNQAVGNVPSLTNALSQWRVDQDNSSSVTTDPLERQGFTKLSVAFNQSGWGENLGRQLSLLLAKNMDSAQIQLDPPELGPLVVKIQINQDQVSLQFTSGHAVVREALEQSSQRLQQMFNDEGLELVDVGVFDQKSGKDSEANERDEQGKSESGRADSSDNSAEESVGLLTHARNIGVDNGNIDYFI